GAAGQLDASATPNFLTATKAQGITISVSRDDGTLLETESWTGAECTLVGGGRSIRCKNATGGTIRFNKTKTPNVFKMTATIAKQNFVSPLPTIAQTPLRVTLTAAGDIDRHAAATSCLPRSN